MRKIGKDHLGQADRDGLKESVHDQHGGKVDDDGRLDVLDVHVHRHQRDEHDGAGGEVDGDDMVGNLSLDRHDEHGFFINSPRVNFRD